MDKLTAGEDRIEVKTDAGEKFQAVVLMQVTGLSGMLRRDGAEVDYTISREVHDQDQQGRWVLTGSENVRLRKL
jgi:hypothetical protein